MTNQELAELMFPNVKMTIEDYEKKYPERNLPEGAMVVRVAPSPTGNVHIGTIYQALLDKKLAEQTGGVFYVRIEDTDQKREIEGGITQIIETLKKFDIEPDEGMITETESKGEYGPYRQSLRKDIYQAYAKYLLAQGKAYPSFESQEELEILRQKQEAAKVRTGYYGVWATSRNLSVEEAAEKIKSGVPYIVRFKSNGREDKKIKHKDVIKGNVEFPENDQDIVIIKADGLPTYHFAHVIDDHLMGTTHVLRGDEWLSSVPLHLQLFYELGFKAPKYAHTPTLLKNDNGGKRKISKRKDPEAAASYYAEKGIPSLSVKEYLMNIANSTFENWRRANPEKPIDEFDFQLNKMGVGGALFDMVKLLDVSKNVISRFSADKVYEEVLIWAKQYDEEFASILEKYKEYTTAVLNIEREQKKPRKDFACYFEIKKCIWYMFDEYFNTAKKEYEWQEIKDINEIKEILNDYVENYYNQDDDKNTWFEKMRSLAEKHGYAGSIKEYKENPENYKGNITDIATVIRVAMTTSSMTPDLYEILRLLGVDRIKERANILK